MKPIVGLRSLSISGAGIICALLLSSGCGSDEEDAPGSANNGGNSGGGASGSGGSNAGTGGRSGGSGGAQNTGGSGGKVCPSTCDDGNGCTVDAVASGSEETCDLMCTHEAIDSCEDDDGCCPAGCTTETDSDCTATSIGAIPEDRRIPWNPGIPGGIPSRTTICTTINASMYGNGTTRADTAIQDAIDACPEGQVVHLPAGEYRLDDGLHINKGVVLRGDGPDATRLRLEGGDTAVEIGSGAPNNIEGVDVTSGFTKGSTSLTLANASDFAVGDVVLIDQQDDGDLVQTGDCEFFKRWDGSIFRSLGQIFEIVSKSGNTIEISSPLYFTYTASLRPQLSQTSPGGTVKNAGVEDLYVTRTSEEGSAMFRLIDAANSWVKNVHSEKVHGRHVSMETCYRCVVRDSYFHDAFVIDPGGTAYGIALERHASDCLIENNIVRNLNIPIVLSVSSGGNVVGYNYVEDPHEESVPAWNEAGIRAHCSYPYMELVEGNLANQGALDFVHGSGGYFTFYRNHFSSQRESFESTANVYALSITTGQYYVNVVGNVLWTRGLPGEVQTACGDGAIYHLGVTDGADCNDVDARVEDTLIRHGNFDYVRNAVEWDPAISDHTLPPSLYLSAKPAFFGDLPWPAIDPEASEPVGVLPAKRRYEMEFAQ